MWKSLDLYHKLFIKVWQIPIIWDIKKQRFTTYNDIKLLIPWFVVLFLELIQLTSCLFFIAKTFFNRDYSLPFFNLLIFLMASILCVTGLTGGLCLGLYVKELVSGLNELIELEIVVNEGKYSVWKIK